MAFSIILKIISKKNDKKLWFEVLMVLIKVVRAVCLYAMLISLYFIYLHEIEPDLSRFFNSALKFYNSPF